MQAASKELINLEKKFWQSMVDEDTETALDMLDEPSFMVSEHGSMQFNHSQYRKMAEQGSMVVKSFELSDVNVVFPTEETAVVTYRVTQAVSERGKSKQIKQEMADSSVWTHKDGKWLCALHTETPVKANTH